MDLAKCGSRRSGRRLELAQHGCSRGSEEVGRRGGITTRHGSTGLLRVVAALGTAIRQSWRGERKARKKWSRRLQGLGMERGRSTLGLALASTRAIGAFTTATIGV